MVISALFPLLLVSLASRLTDLNDQLLLLLNSAAGRSWLFDSIVAFFLDNDLAKAGVIGCCFLAAWYGGKSTNSTNARRKILITTLVAAVFVITTTKVLSKTIFLPRPEIQSQKIYRLEAEQLVEMKRIPVRIMLDETSQKDYRALLSGDVETNDLGSFPSDHAGQRGVRREHGVRRRSVQRRQHQRGQRVHGHVLKAWHCAPYGKQQLRARLSMP